MAATIGGVLLLDYNIFGRRITRLAAIRMAALDSGIQIKARDDLGPSCWTGALAGVAALILSARSHAARPDVVQGMELDVIASVIRRLQPVRGPRFSALGTLLGSLIIGTLNNGLVLLGVSSPMQSIIKGAIIVAAVAFTKR